MTTQPAAKQDKEHGVSLVEFVLTLPILVFLIMGAFDLGWAVYANNSVAVSAREGARRAIIVSADNNAVCNAAKRGLQNIPLDCTFQNGAPPANAQGIFVQPQNRPTSYAGKMVTVTVQYLYRPITPLFTPFLPSGLMLRSAASMMAE